MLVSNIIAEVHKIVQLRPDVSYDPGVGECKYADGTCSDNSVGCLFGQVLSNLGIDVNRFDNYPVSDRPECMSTYIPSINKILEKEFEGTEEEINWCAKVQEKQDDGLCWEDAVYAADLVYKPICV